MLCKARPDRLEHHVTGAVPNSVEIRKTTQQVRLGHVETKACAKLDEGVFGMRLREPVEPRREHRQFQPGLVAQAGEVEDLFAGRQDQIDALARNDPRDCLTISVRIEARRWRALVPREPGRGPDRAAHRVGENDPVSRASQQPRHV